MATKTYAQLVVQTTVQDADLLATYRGAGPLKSLTALIFKNYVGSSYLPLAGGTMTGALLSAVGSESAPGLSFAGDTDTGFYRIGANNVGLAVGGVKVADFASGATSIVGTLTATAFSGPLTGNVTGNLTGNVTGNVTGDVTGNASTATAWATGRTISITGDLTYTSSSLTGAANVTGTGTLATVNSNVGSFGSATAVPVITVNAKGLITAASTATLTALQSSELNQQNGAYTLVLGDAGKTIFLAAPSGALTIPANASVALPVGTIIEVYAKASGSTIAITSDTLTWFPGTGSTSNGTRNIAVGGHATLWKYATTQWYISGIGLS